MRSSQSGPLTDHFFSPFRTYIAHTPSTYTTQDHGTNITTRRNRTIPRRPRELLTTHNPAEKRPADHVSECDPHAGSVHILAREEEMNAIVLQGAETVVYEPHPNQIQPGSPGDMDLLGTQPILWMPPLDGYRGNEAFQTHRYAYAASLIEVSRPPNIEGDIPPGTVLRLVGKNKIEVSKDVARSRQDIGVVAERVPADVDRIRIIFHG